jgi:hypoxanthine-DNA glycosylase
VITDKVLEFLAYPIQGLTAPVAAAEQYYANPGNDFWKLVGAALNQTFEGFSYEEKLGLLRDNRMGLWDAYQTCVRPGSMDSDITEQELTDFEALKSVARNIA